MPLINVSTQCNEVKEPESAFHFVPMTDLGRSLVAIRECALSRGMRVLTVREVLEEVKRIRGEKVDEGQDLS